MAIVQDWKIRSRSHHCCYSGEPFEDGEGFYTVIFDDPQSDGFVRRDYSEKHWPLIRKNLDPPPFSHWRSVYEAPVPEEKSEAMGQESAETMLRRMIDEDDPATENARYILALMLERKKTLRPVDEKETDSRKLIFYEHKTTGDVFIVADPQLKLDDLGRVQEEVTVLLGGRPKQTGETGENSDSNSGGDALESRGNTDPPTPMASPTDLLHSLKSHLDELIVQLRLGKAEAIDYVEKHKEQLSGRIAEVREALGDGEKHAGLRARLNELRVQLALGRMESRDRYEEQREKIHSAIDNARGEFHHLEDGVKAELEEKSESFETKLNALALNLGIAGLVAEDELEVRKEEIALKARRLADRLKAAGKDAGEQAEAFAHEARDAWDDLRDNLSRLFR